MLRKNNTLQEILAHVNEDLIPNECFCPITREIMKDPVTTQDGHSYEHTAIKSWFKSGHRTSPITNQPLTNTQIFSNHALRNLIQETISLLALLQKQEQEKSFSWLRFFQNKQHKDREGNKSLQKDKTSSFSKHAKCLIM